jgi:hypothetical protein
MTIKASTGLRDAMLDTAAFRTVMNLCFLDIYAGTVPADADAAIGAATLLCTISNNSGVTGLTFAASASGGIITKTLAEVWSGVNVATGTASFYRLRTAADDGTASTTQERVQGTVGVAGADLNLSSTSLVSAATQTIDAYNIALPA